MKDTIILHLDWKAFLDVLPDEDLGQWTRAILQYMETGQPPTGMSKAVEVAFYASFERIGRDAERYEAKCAVRREAGRKGGLRSGETRRLYHDEANEAKRSKTNMILILNLILILYYHHPMIIVPSLSLRRR